MQNKQTTKTYNPSQQEERWYLVDATGLRIGQVASRVSELLLGKNDPKTRDYLLPQNKVVVINAANIDATEKRKQTKVYTRYSGYPSGLTKETLEELLERRPSKPLEKAIKGMLPKGSRGDRIFKRNLFVYDSAEHKHEAQKPEKIDITKAKF